MPKGNPNPNMSGLKPWKPGESPNPGGKPVNARNKITNQFLTKLAEDFETNGQKAIEETREKHPDRYLMVVAALVPKTIDVNHEGELSIRSAALSAVAELIAESESAGSSGIGPESLPN